MRCTPLRVDRGMQSKLWLEYFRRNRHRPEVSVPERIGFVDPQLHAALLRSLQRFQIGETGEGRIVHEVARSRDPAIDDDTREAVALYIREEGRHARELSRLIAALGGRALSRDTTEIAFRWLRRALGVRTKMLTLCAAEVVGAVFYELVAERVASPPVAAVAERIALDEAAHLDFQAAFFAEVLTRTAPELRAAYGALLAATFVAILTAACGAVAVDQRQLFAVIGVTPRELARRCRAQVARRWPVRSLAPPAVAQLAPARLALSAT